MPESPNKTTKNRIMDYKQVSQRLGSFGEQKSLRNITIWNAFVSAIAIKQNQNKVIQQVRTVHWECVLEWIKVSFLTFVGERRSYRWSFGQQRRDKPAQTTTGRGTICQPTHHNEEADISSTGCRRTCRQYYSHWKYHTYNLSTPKRRQSIVQHRPMISVFCCWISLCIENL